MTKNQQILDIIISSENKKKMWKHIGHLKIKIKLKDLRKKISWPKNKLQGKEKGQKPKTKLKNGLCEKVGDEQYLLPEEKYLLRELLPK